MTPQPPPTATVRSEAVLHLGDCLDVMRGMDDKSVNAIITDLPYGSTQNSWDEVIPFAPMWKQVKRVLQDGGAFVTTASQPFASALVMSNPEWFRYEWIWEKDRATGHLDAPRRPMRKHESILVFSPSGATYNPQISRKPRENIRPISRRAASDCYGSYSESAERGIPLDMTYPLSVLKINTANNDERGEHPTQKPIELYRYLVRTYTHPGDTVLDFTMGSGTTGVAAIKEGRRFIGVELNANYFAIAQRRIEDAAAQPLLFEVQP